MDIWTPDVQEGVLKLVTAVLAIVVAWVGVKAKSYLAAMEAQALQAARETGVQVLEQVAEAAARYVEQAAKHKFADLTNPEKLAIAADWVQNTLPGVSHDTAVGAVEAMLNRLKCGYGTITPPTELVADGPPDADATNGSAATGQVVLAPAIPPTIGDPVQLVKQAEDVAAALEAKADEIKQAAGSIGGIAASFGLARPGDE